MINQVHAKLEFVETQIQQVAVGDSQNELETLRKEKTDWMNKVQELTNQKNTIQADLQSKAQEVLDLRMVSHGKQGLKVNWFENFKHLFYNNLFETRALLHE